MDKNATKIKIEEIKKEISAINKTLSIQLIDDISEAWNGTESLHFIHRVEDLNASIDKIEKYLDELLMCIEKYNIAGR